MPTAFAFLDLETTGKDPKKDQIWSYTLIIDVLEDE
jgi:hypothetical protein